MHTRKNKPKTTHRVLFDLPMLEITKIREDATRREAQNQIESPKDTNPEASLTLVWSLRKHFGGGGRAEQGTSLETPSRARVGYLFDFFLVSSGMPVLL